ncbi:MAG: DUF6526 family protein [Acidobacteriota bacterium]|nr:DUF6526 family protein [Acidobacteriota bacterium]
MAEQSYEDHAYHPVPTYWATGFILLTLGLMYGHLHRGWHTGEWAFFTLVLAVMILLSITRWNTVALQDRIIMLEMKVRCAEILPAGQDAALAKLSTKQIVALRFASDEELGALLERAARENLAPKAIKASIQTWRPDPHRT